MKENRKNRIQKCFIIFISLIFLQANFTTGLAQSQGADTPISHEDDLKIALASALPGETLYVTDMNITKELYFESDIDVTIASATGNPVTIHTVKPSAGTYPFNFNGGNLNLTFENIIIEGDNTHVLMRFQSTREITRTVTGGVFRNGYRAGNGGALFVENGNIKVINCRFENNTAMRGSGLYLGNNVKTGGNGDAIIENCIFINNTATNYEGGAVSVRNDYNVEKGNMTVINSRFENNLATGGSGGAISGMGDITIHTCRFINNSAINGGAISSDGKQCTIVDSEISGNRSTMNDDTADLYKQYDFACGGGGIYSSSANITLINSRINGNQTTQDGGGICSSQGTVMLSGSIIENNKAVKDGGGIWIADLTNLTANDIIFENNQASIGYYWRTNSPADEAQATDAILHGIKISDTAYTAPYTNAYSNHDVNYKAGSVLTPYSVTYYGNGEKVLIDQASPYLTGESVTILKPPDNLVKPGYIFTAWNAKPDGTGDNYTYNTASGVFSPVLFTMGSQNIVLYAQWEKIAATPAPPTATTTPAATPAIPGTSPEIESQPEVPTDYPPGYEVKQKDDNTAEVIDPDGNSAGEWVHGDTGWNYYPNPDNSQLVPQEDGSLEVLNPDGTTDGLWSKNEDDEWVYENYTPFQRYKRWIIFGGSLLALVGLLALLYFLIIARRHITREEFARMLVTAIHLEKDIRETVPYEDVSEDSGYYNAVMNAREAGLLSNYAGDKFGPDIKITREEIANISAETVRYANASVTVEPIDLGAAFKDFDEMDEMLLDDIRLAIQYKIMKGRSDDRFDPKGLCYRVQVRKIIKCLLATITPYWPPASNDEEKH